MKRLIIILILSISPFVCTATIPSSAQNESRQNPSTLTIVFDSCCVPLDTNLTISIDSAALSVFVHNLFEKRRYGTELDGLDVKINGFSSLKDAKIKDIVFLILGIILTLGLILIYLFYFVKRRDNIINTVISSERIKKRILNTVNVSDLYLEIEKLNSNYSALQKRIGNLEEKIGILEKRNNSSFPQQEETDNPSSTKKRETQPILTVRKYYAESIQDNRYVKVKETQTDDAIFEIAVKPDKNTATVTVCKAAFRKVLANPSFLDGCDKQVFGNTTVNIDEEGTAERTDDNKWVVRKQIKVVLK